jgi:hypothetical protein
VAGALQHSLAMWRCVTIAVLVAGALLTASPAFADRTETCRAEAESLMGNRSNTSSPDVSGGSVSGRGNPSVSNAQDSNDDLVYQEAFEGCLRRFGEDKSQRSGKGGEPRSTR